MRSPHALQAGHLKSPNSIIETGASSFPKVGCLPIGGKSFITLFVATLSSLFNTTKAVTAAKMINVATNNNLM